MRKLIGVALVIAGLCAIASAQSRVQLGAQAAGDRDRGYKAASLGIIGRGVIRFGSTAVDAEIEWVIHAPKEGPDEPGGRTISTDVLVRRYVIGGVYAVAGVDVSKLSTVLLDTTAAGAATGMGIEIGAFRAQVIYQPPDFTSGQSLSGYKLEAEYIRTLGCKQSVGCKHYISFRLRGQASRFERDAMAGTLTGERFGLVISVGRFF